MLDGYMLANNIEHPQDCGESSANPMGQQKAWSPVHPHILPTSPALSLPPVPSPLCTPAEDHVDPDMPDTRADATLLDNGYNLIQCDDLDDNAWTAGPSDAPGSPDVSQHLGPYDTSQLPDANHMGPPEDFEPESLRLDGEGEAMVTAIRLPKLQMTQVFIDLL